MMEVELRQAWHIARARPDRWSGSARATQDTFGPAVRDLKGFVHERSGEL